MKKYYVYLILGKNYYYILIMKKLLCSDNFELSFANEVFLKVKFSIQS